MARRRTHRAERLSKEATAIIDEGLDKGVAYDVIAEQIAEQTGEAIGASSVQRYYTAKWKPRREAERQARIIGDTLADRLTSLDDQQLQQAIKLRTAEALLPMLMSLAADSPQHAARFFADLDFNRVEHAKIEQRREEVEARVRLTEQKLDIERGKLERIRAAAASALKKTGDKTPAAVRKAIADIYGIAISEAQAGDGAIPSSSPVSAADSQASKAVSK